MGWLFVSFITGLLQLGCLQGDLERTHLATSSALDSDAPNLVTVGPAFACPGHESAPFIEGRPTGAPTSCVTSTARPKWRVLVAVEQTEVRGAGQGRPYATANLRPPRDSWDASHDVLRV